MTNKLQRHTSWPQQSFQSEITSPQSQPDAKIDSPSSDFAATRPQVQRHAQQGRRGEGNYGIHCDVDLPSWYFMSSLDVVQA